MRFADKIAVVTGAGSGIGRAAARMFAAEGATVIANDIRGDAAEATVADIKAADGKAEALAGDIADGDHVRRSAKDIVARHGRIDLLVAAAGYPFSGPAETFTELPRLLEVNVVGTFNWCQAAAVESMIPNRSGAIVIISSLAGLAAIPGDIGYVVAKHGLVGMTKALALEWARYGIRVNCVAPGLTRTLMADEAAKNRPEFFAARVARIPAGRIAEPEDQARAILLLCSDDAGYVTGHTMPVDGGQMSMHSGFSVGREG